MVIGNDDDVDANCFYCVFVLCYDAPIYYNVHPAIIM